VPHAEQKNVIAIDLLPHRTTKTIAAFHDIAYLGDLARHVANAYHQNTGADPNAVLQSIKGLFDAEMGSPTDEPSGQVLP
jgi:hypothetical protein